MKSKVTLLFIVVVALNTCAIAQNSSQTEWLSDSSRSIQFGIGSSFSVQSFDDKSISFKFFLTPRRAIRLGFSFFGSIDKRETHEETSINGSTVLPYDISYDPTKSLNVEISAQHLWYCDTGTDVFLFLGFGPVGEYQRQEYIYASGWSLTTGWSAGVGGTIGGEWFVHRRISLHAEYQAAGQYGSTRTKDLNYESNGSYAKIDEYRNYDWSITSQRVLFGFSIYF